MFFFFEILQIKKKPLIAHVQLKNDPKQIIIEISIFRSYELAGYPMFNGIWLIKETYSWNKLTFAGLYL